MSPEMYNEMQEYQLFLNEKINEFKAKLRWAVDAD